MAHPYVLLSPHFLMFLSFLSSCDCPLQRDVGKIAYEVLVGTSKVH